MPDTAAATVSDTDICNMALIKLGAQPITGLDTDTSEQAVMCNAVYKIARDAALRSHPWNFARVWAPLTTLAQQPLSLLIKPDPHFQGEIIYTGSYEIPADCVRVFRASPFNYNFRIVGKALYTDAPPQNINSASFIGAQPGVGLPPATDTLNPNVVGIEYISRNTDPTIWDTMFVEALVCKIAAHLAWPITSSMDTKKAMEAEYKDALNEAWYADGAEQWSDELYNNILTDVRNIVGAPDGSIPY